MKHFLAGMRWFAMFGFAGDFPSRETPAELLFIAGGVVTATIITLTITFTLGVLL